MKKSILLTAYLLFQIVSLKSILYAETRIKVGVYQNNLLQSCVPKGPNIVSRFDLRDNKAILKGDIASMEKEIPKWMWWVLGAAILFFLHHLVLHLRYRTMAAKLREKNLELQEEIAVRKQVEEELTQHQRHLEEIVEERTRDLRESEKKYRLLADNVSDTIWTMDVNTKFTYLSPSIERLAGYTQEEAAYLALADLLTPASLKIAGESIQRRLASGDAESTTLLELEIVRKDGSTFWSEISSTPVQDVQGNTTGFLGITRDISERIKTQEALKESEERLRLALDAANTGMYDVNMKTGLVYLSSTFYTKLGYEPGELPTTMEDFFSFVHPD